MTHILSIDPGLNTGIALGFYDATTPYRLLERWQVHRGVDGFYDWWWEQHSLGGRLHRDSGYDLVVESFSLREDNSFAADLTPVRLEGAIAVLNSDTFVRPIAWQQPSDKGSLIGYSEKAKSGTKANRQRERFDFLDRFGLFKAGTENDDSNDAITHALVSLKRAQHMPTLLTYWPPRERLTLVGDEDVRAAPGF